MGCIYRDGICTAENCKNHFKIEEKIIFKKKNDVVANVGQRESNNIKRYVLAFSNI